MPPIQRTGGEVADLLRLAAVGADELVPAEQRQQVNADEIGTEPVRLGEDLGILEQAEPRLDGRAAGRQLRLATIDGRLNEKMIRSLELEDGRAGGDRPRL